MIMIMIGVSGGRQSLYTSRPWGLKPLTLLHKACLKSRSLPGGQDVFSCIFQVSISIGTFVSNSLSLSTTDGTKWTSFNYDWGISIAVGGYYLKLNCTQNCV